MKLKVFSVYDGKAKVWSHPFYAINTASGVRSFAVAVNGSDSLLATHPSDFCLFELGSFDDELGIVEMFSPHVNLGLGSQFKEVSHATATVGDGAHVLPSAKGGNSAEHVR